MKKIIVSIFICLSLVGCSNSGGQVNKIKEKNEQNNEKFNYTSYLDGVDIRKTEKIKVEAEHAINISDITALRDFNDYIFIGTIDSIDGCTTTRQPKAFLPMPQIYGKISVLDNLVGDIEQSQIRYFRTGGTLKVSEYYKDAPQDLIDNDNARRISSGQELVQNDESYMTFQYENDITLEAGKTYLFFTVYEQETKAFIITGVEYGTREVAQKSTNKRSFRSMPAESTLNVLNNETGKYEALDSLIEVYFK